MKKRVISRLGRSPVSTLLSLRLGAVCLAAIGLAGCSLAESDSLSQGETFVPIARQTDSSTMAVRKSALTNAAGPDLRDVGANEDFYLAISKKELGQRFFLSSYIKQYWPGAVSYGSARAIGTRVVTFRIQNNKLYVFDVTDGKKASDTFDPTLIVEAYPLVKDFPAFERLPGSKNYVLIDPSAGRNRFSILIDAWSTAGQADRFAIELAFMQRFRRIADGVTFEMVFTGYSDKADPNAGGLGEPNPFRTSGTLGLGLRRYSEGPGFTSAPVPTDAMDNPYEYFFRSEPLIVANAGVVDQGVDRWNVIKSKTQPIEWVISDHIDSIKSDPNFKDLDLLGALQKGVTNWNQVFGFEALKARKALPSETYSDDDTNYLVFDEDPSFGAAFANWRSNPNTGEIRGSSVYFSKLWLEVADQLFEDDMARTGSGDKLKPRQLPKTFQLMWEAMPQRPVCNLWAFPYRMAEGEVRRVPGKSGEWTSLTKQQKMTSYITHVVAHEIGHTLGLRHNFKGSLKFEGDGKRNSSSVMEYIDDFDAVFNDTPGSYDTEAIQLLYGLPGAKQPPLTDRFCTDDDVGGDPTCAPFDTSADPLNQDYGAIYNNLLDAFFAGVIWFGSTGRSLNGVLKFARATVNNSSATRVAAWNLAWNRISAPLSADKLATPGYAVRADAYARTVLSRAFLDAANLRSSAYGPTTDPPIGDANLNTVMLRDIRALLLNLDAVRSYTTRRVTVDVLKKLQTSAAYAILREAQTDLEMKIPGLDMNERPLAEDLLERIKKAVTPYFLT